MADISLSLDIAKAKAFTLWVKSIIGTEPRILVTDESVSVDFTQDQAKDFRAWLDDQVGGMLQPKEPGQLQINLSPVLIPWAVKYLAPIIGSGILAGYFLGNRKARKIIRG